MRGAELAFPVRIVSAEEVNGIEEPVGEARFEGNRLLVDAGRFAPKTYKVTLAEAPVAAPRSRMPLWISCKPELHFERRVQVRRQGG